MGVRVPVVQVVGYSNSGKTTLVEKLVTYCMQKGMTVATIKHHGHAGEDLVASDEQKDSWRHRQAGAAATAVTAGGALQLQLNRREPWQVDELISWYQAFEVDVIVIEGFKQEKYPKVVLVKNKQEFTSLRKLTNVIGVISWDGLDPLPQTDVPLFEIRDDQTYVEWLYDYLERKEG